MSAPDVIQIVLVSLTAIGLFLTAYQLLQTRKLKRLDIVRQAWESIAADNELMELYYRIEYSDFQYTTDFHGSPDEKLLDKLLGRIQIVALYYEKGLISWSDVMLMEYHLDRIILNVSIQNYFDFLSGWSKNQNLEEHVFAAVERLGSKYRANSKKWG